MRKDAEPIHQVTNDFLAHPITRRGTLGIIVAVAAGCISIAPEPTPIPIITPEPTRTPKPTKKPTPEPTPYYDPELEGYRPGDVVFYGSRDETQAFRTVDDGWDSENVANIVDKANESGVKLTIFPVGIAVERDPNLYQEIAYAGHLIGNHTWDHPYLSDLSRQDIEDQIQRQQEAVWEAVGFEYPQVFLRPPFGDGIRNGEAIPKLRAAAGKFGLILAMWDSDTFGYNFTNASDKKAHKNIMRNVRGNIQNGSIILQHFIQDDVDAFDDITRLTQDRGLATDQTMAQGILLANGIQVPDMSQFPVRPSPSEEVGGIEASGIIFRG